MTLVIHLLKVDSSVVSLNLFKSYLNTIIDMWNI